MLLDSVIERVLLGASQFCLQCKNKYRTQLGLLGSAHMELR